MPQQAARAPSNAYKQIPVIYMVKDVFQFDVFGGYLRTSRYCGHDIYK